MGLMTALVRGGAPAPIVQRSAGDPFAFVRGEPVATITSSAGMAVSQATALQVSSVYACVRIRSRDLARCTPQVVRASDDGTQTIIADHPLAALLRRPNRLQTWFEFAEMMHAAYLLRGNAYAVILRDWRGTPVELVPVNPDLVQLLEAADGSLFYSVSRAGQWMMARLAGLPQAVPAEDVLHIRDLGLNALMGLSRIGLAREAIGLAMGQERQAARWVGNGARPSGILTSPKGVDEPTAKRLKAQWESFHGGVANAGGTAVLEDGMKFEPLQLTAEDIEFMAARKAQTAEIARFMDVPLHKLGELDNIPRATIAELNADYVQTTVMGDCERWEQRLAHQFGLDGEGLSVNFDERALLRADILTMRNAARLGVLSGIVTPNEARREIGYGPQEGGDTLLSPTNLAPHGSAVDGTPPDGAGRPPSGEPAV